ncbi:uncharacterized protein LOC126326069 [Schistocerca gregaria]|uniref:uncharacterized protein LOC126326069 n=1 Tax=Schistocerca gregaria TaxID=7010 RepID=UPI00211EC445|nr:uncharacterized protein LOC126326069 [Schistocerca gregaria]
MYIFNPGRFLLRSAGNCPTALKRHYAKIPDNIRNVVSTFRTKQGPVSLKSLIENKKVIFVGVPGAFTPVCTNQVSEYAEKLGEFKKRGIESIYVVSVNDHHVMDAWREMLKIGEEITFLADHSGEFTRAINQEIDLSAGGLGKRSQRYSLVVDDGRVVREHIEVSPGNIDVSNASFVLENL